MSTPSADYINYICARYNDVYDDRVEDTKPGGLNWIPGVEANHKSLAAFQKELAEQGIKPDRPNTLESDATGYPFEAVHLLPCPCTHSRDTGC